MAGGAGARGAGGRDQKDAEGDERDASNDEQDGSEAEGSALGGACARDAAIILADRSNKSFFKCNILISVIYS